MQSGAINYLLSFLAGVVVAIVVMLVPEHAASFWVSLSGAGIPDLAWALSPALIALAVLTLAAVYWGRSSTAASQILKRPSQIFLGSSAEHRAAVRTRDEQKEVGAVRDELERQLGRLVVLIAGQLKNSKEHVDTLKDTSAELASVTTVSEIRDVVQKLISRNETDEHQTRDLEARLKTAQDQASSLRQRLTQAEALAAIDPLTAVANRRGFEQFISAAIERSHTNRTPLCLIMTDIDHFKRVNDNHGHAAGDKVLKAFADLLTKSVRGGDLVARFGGEEFAVVLPQTPMGDAFGIAERIRRNFEHGPDEMLFTELGRLTASFGVAEIRDGERPNSLIRRADQMLYEAKNKGRNTTIIWSSSSGGAES
jgi:diguanylate cyclase